MKKTKPINEEELKVPAYLRKRKIYNASRQKLILTALDRKDAGLQPNSKVATAPAKKSPARRTRRKLGISPRAPRLEHEDGFDEPIIGTESLPVQKSEPAALPLKPKKLKQVGEVTDFLDNINVAIILLNQKGVKKGDTLLIEGDEFIFTQSIDEMQIDRKDVTKAKKGSHIGLKVKFPAEVDGKVYVIS